MKRLFIIKGIPFKIYRCVSKQTQLALTEHRLTYQKQMMIINKLFSIEWKMENCGVNNCVYEQNIANGCNV